MKCPQFHSEDDTFFSQLLKISATSANYYARIYRMVLAGKVTKMVRRKETFDTSPVTRELVTFGFRPGSLYFCAH